MRAFLLIGTLLFFVAAAYALDTIEEDDESDPQEGLDDYDFDEVMKDEEADPYRPARKAILYFPKPVRKLKAFCLCRNIKKKKRRGDEPEEFEEYSSSDPSKRKRGKGKRKWRRRLMISKFILTFLRRWRALFNTRIKRHCYCTRRAKAIRAFIGPACRKFKFPFCRRKKRRG